MRGHESQYSSTFARRPTPLLLCASASPDSHFFFSSSDLFLTFSFLSFLLSSFPKPRISLPIHFPFSLLTMPCSPSLYSFFLLPSSLFFSSLSPSFSFTPRPPFRSKLRQSLYIASHFHGFFRRQPPLSALHIWWLIKCFHQSLFTLWSFSLLGCRYSVIFDLGVDGEWCWSRAACFFLCGAEVQVHEMAE